MQVGSDAQESQRLIEEIQNTGVIQSQDAAESATAHDEKMSEDDASSIPTPVITRS